MAGRFNCTQCAKAFTAKSTLNSHLASVHRGERSVCGGCQKLFTDKSNFRRHRRSCTGNASIIRCAWHGFGCTHTSSRVDNVRRHSKSCTHRPGTWAGGVLGPVAVNQGEPAQNNNVLNNRPPQVDGLQHAVQSAPAQGQSPQAMLPVEAALAQGPVVTPQVDVDASEPGDPTDPVWFAANYPLFGGYWKQEEEPTAAPQSHIIVNRPNRTQQVVVGGECPARHNGPFTSYGLGKRAFLPVIEQQDDDDSTLS
ncbi:hypothetical protein AYL99_05962 [Fonsecaea erecta]|uniref:C2H2-type domain-containing protein n=1 Tax=Fonsecaea erecta TaxID=1367422 RepID=A0A178ZME0_9EURO|nr:hypothetical protein AYL99_05962 [Fonsecaea erecta]OAP60960.1 hypothetical protein AYL99_05962 [Fonsecaea erecta]